MTFSFRSCWSLSDCSSPMCHWHMLFDLSRLSLSYLLVTYKLQGSFDVQIKLQVLFSKDDINYIILTTIYTAFSKLLLWKQAFHSVYCSASWFTFSRMLAQYWLVKVYIHMIIPYSVSIGTCFGIKLGHSHDFLLR